MKTENIEIPALRLLEGVNPIEHPGTGTVDDDDDRDDEHAGENEALVRRTDENVESPEEFEIDDEDTLGHPEDDDADEEQDEA